jgi:hypothetical protein
MAVDDSGVMLVDRPLVMRIVNGPLVMRIVNRPFVMGHHRMRIGVGVRGRLMLVVLNGRAGVGRNARRSRGLDRM